MAQIEQKERRIGWKVNTTLAVSSGFLMGGIAGIMLNGMTSEKPVSLFDCNTGRSGDITLILPKGQEYVMKAITGGKATLKTGDKGDVTVLIKDSDNKSFSVHAPAVAEDERTIYQIEGRNVSGQTVIDITATCKTSK